MKCYNDGMDRRAWFRAGRLAAQCLLAAALSGCALPARATPVVITQIVTATPPPPTVTAPPTPSPIGAATQPPTPLPSLTPLGGGSPGISLTPGVTGTQTISITSFSAAPPLIDPGGTIVLTWQATGGELYLYRLNALGQLGEPTEVPPVGMLTVTTEPGVRNQVSFALFAVDRGSGAQAQAVTSVRVRCPDQWFFANGPSACPMSAAESGRAVAEHFERGLMIWLSWRGVYVLYADGRAPRWDFRTDNFVEGQPESDPNLVPPGGLYQPVRGFGLIWRDENQVLGSRVRDRLGWATDQEFEIPGAFQCDSTPRYPNCYLAGPESQVILLLPERSGWSVWPTPSP